MKELPVTRMKNPFDDSMRDVNGRFLIHNEQLKRWREHFITILTYLASFEIRFVGDDMTIRCGELFQTEKKLSSNINARSKGVKHRPCRSSYRTAKCKVLHRSKMRNLKPKTYFMLSRTEGRGEIQRTILSFLEHPVYDNGT